MFRFPEKFMFGVHCENVLLEITQVNYYFHKVYEIFNKSVQLRFAIRIAKIHGMWFILEHFCTFNVFL